MSTSILRRIVLTNNGEGVTRFFIPGFLELVALVCMFEAGDSARSNNWTFATIWFFISLAFSLGGFTWIPMKKRIIEWRSRRNQKTSKTEQIDAHAVMPSDHCKPQHNVQCVRFKVISEDSFPLTFATLGFQNVPTRDWLMGKFEYPRLRVIYYANSTGQEIADFCPLRWYPEDELTEIASEISYAQIATFLSAVPVWRFFELNENATDEWHKFNYLEVPSGDYRIVAMLSGSHGLSIPPVTGVLTLREDGTASFLRTTE